MSTGGPPNKLGYYWWLLEVDGAALRGTSCNFYSLHLDCYQVIEKPPVKKESGTQMTREFQALVVCLTCLHWEC